MRIIVLGCYGTCPGRGGACSGYLVISKNTKILLDCGNGVISRLQQYYQIDELDAIVLTHFHVDHVGDIPILRYALETKGEYSAIQKIPKIYCPNISLDRTDILPYTQAFDINVIYDGMESVVGDIRLKFLAMKHSIESYGVKVENKGKVLAYSGDTMLNNNLVRLASNADILLCESTLTEKMKSRGAFPHLSAREAAYVAREASADKLLLTHLWYDEDIEQYLMEAKEIFDNSYLAEEHKIYVL